MGLNPYRHNHKWSKAIRPIVSHIRNIMHTKFSKHFAICNLQFSATGRPNVDCESELACNMSLEHTAKIVSKPLLSFQWNCMFLSLTIEGATEKAY
jgi:hypothetical protein